MGDEFPSNSKIIQCDGIDVGCLTLSKCEDVILIEQLYIMPSFQNRGIGRSVVSTLLTDAALAEQSVQVTVLVQSPSVHLFTRLGFSVATQTQRSLVMEYRP